LLHIFVLRLLPQPISELGINLILTLSQRPGWALRLLLPHLLQSVLDRILHQDVELFSLLVAAALIGLWLSLCLLREGVSLFSCFSSEVHFHFGFFLPHLTLELFLLSDSCECLTLLIGERAGHDIEVDGSLGWHVALSLAH